MKKRSKKSKNGSVRGSALVPRNMGCPQESRVVLKYQASGNFATGGAPYAYSNYSLNSVFDPLYDLGGGVVTGFKEWMGLYKYYLVTRSVIFYRYMNTVSAGVGADTTMFIVPYGSSQSSESGTPPTLDVIRESFRSVYHNNFQAPSFFNPFGLDLSVDISSLEGGSVTSQKVLYSGYSNTDPPLQPFAKVGIISSDGVTDGRIGPYEIVIQYYCTFWQKRAFGD